MKAYRTLAITVCGLLLGCDAPVESAPTELRSGCYPRCGFNSAEVNGRSIRELHLDGQANADNMQIVGFLAPQGILGNYKLEVEGDELVAKKVGGGGELRGNGLVLATILVKKTGLLNLPVPITILGYDEVDSWADGADPVPTYALVYPDLTSVIGQRNVCNDGLLDLLTSTVSVLGGETYDLEDKTVNSGTGMSRWFTLACPGSAADKLRFLGYGPQSSSTSSDQRQATLKMMTAAYCPNSGTSYTENGTPLQWENADGTAVTPDQDGDIEAVWTKDGALCLGTPRIANTTPACSLPSCSSFTLDDGEWLTRTP